MDHQTPGALIRGVQSPAFRLRLVQVRSLRNQQANFVLYTPVNWGSEFSLQAAAGRVRTRERRCGRRKLKLVL